MQRGEIQPVLTNCASVVVERLQCAPDNDLKGRLLPRSERGGCGIRGGAVRVARQYPNGEGRSDVVY